MKHSTTDLLRALLDGKRLKMKSISANEYIKIVKYNDFLGDRVVVCYNSDTVLDTLAQEYMIQINTNPEKFIILD